MTRAFLLSAYRMPAQHPVQLDADEMAAWLNGYALLWHPALLSGMSEPPRVDASYDHDSPNPGDVFAVPFAPQLFLPDTWGNRVSAAGALRFEAAADRGATLESLRNALRAPETTAESPNAFDTPEVRALIDVGVDTLRPFWALGLGYLLVDSLYEAMDHERLLAAADFWEDVRRAVKALLAGSPTDVQTHLSGAAARLQTARELLIANTVYLLDIATIEEEVGIGEWDGLVSRDAEALRSGALRSDSSCDIQWLRNAPLRKASASRLTNSSHSPLNLIATGDALECLAARDPEKLAALRKKLHPECSPPLLEFLGGVYREREDALLPIASQLWNLYQGRAVSLHVAGAEVTTYARGRTAFHPYSPMFLQTAGLTGAIYLSFDKSVVPSHYSTVVNWPAPDGRAVTAFTRAPQSANSPQTFFNLAYHLHQTLTHDGTPTLAFFHRGPPAEAYFDWLELARLAPVFGQWTTFGRYFGEAVAGEYVGPANADDFFPDYLEERVNSGCPDPVSAFARHACLRRRIDAVWTYAAVLRTLGAATEAESESLRILTKLENAIESAAPDGPVDEETLVGLETAWAQRLADRLQTRAPEGRPGLLLLNPCAFTRRVTLELDGQPGPVAVEGPVKASQFDEGKSRLVVELPPLGYAWIPRGSASTPMPKQRIRMAEPTIVRNEFFEAEIDPSTGSLRSFRDLRTRTNHLAAQVVYNPGSRMEGRDVRMTVNGSALGELVTESVLLDTANEELATVRQRFRAWLGRPVLDLRVEIVPNRPPEGYPWHAYFAVRLAWGDERSGLARGVCGTAHSTHHTRPQTPDFLEIRLGKQNAVIYPGGLPFHQRHGTRMLDVILITQGETASIFELGLACQRENLLQPAVGLVSPVGVVATEKGPPHIGPVGSVLYLDAPQLSLIGLRPAGDGRALMATLMETAGYGGTTEIRCPRDPVRAVSLDAADSPVQYLRTEGDIVQVDFSAGELLRIRIDFE